MTSQARPLRSADEVTVADQGAGVRPPRRTPPKPSPLGLMALGLLAERPMHPYEMQRVMTDRAKDKVIRVQRGSLYPVVDRLVAAGLAEPVEVSRDGKRPERTVYHITDYGRDVVDTWLLDMLREPRNEFPEFPAALAFMALINPEAAAGALESRMLKLTSQLAGMAAITVEIGDKLPRLFLLEAEYQAAVLRAELEWVRGVLADLRSGALNWNDELIRQWAAAAQAQIPMTAR